jgi:two-component system sensor histidine kinase PilS (NtrC family)
VTRDGRVLTANAAASEILGAPVAAGRPIEELMPSLRPLLDATAEAGALRRGEIVHARSDGARVLGVSLSPLSDAGGALLGRIVNFQDVTQLRDMEEAMARSERLAAVGRLAAGIAHEIRNPLAAISGSIELLAQPAAGGGADSGELMAIVMREVARLNALITELLEFARPRAPETQPIDLQASLAELLRVAEHDKQLDGARVELSAPQPVWVEADAAQLRQVVWNLLRNAAEASPSGAPITVELGAEDEFARLTVRDRGPGIAAENRPRVFEPFFSTKEGGTGLGLATVHRIVEEHHGRVEIADAPGGGAAIIVRLPIRTAP